MSRRLSNIKIKKYFVIGNLMLGQNIKILNKMKKSVKILKNILTMILLSQFLKKKYYS